MNLDVDIERLASELDHLATFSDAEPPAVTRIVYSQADQQARLWLRNLCDESGLSTRVDALGNLFARWEVPGHPTGAVGTGSHIDAIPHSGRYDGTVGVLGGLEAIRTLQRSGFKPARPIELLAFISEEPTRFGIGCLGSRMLCGGLKADQASALKDKHDDLLPAIREAAGFTGPLDGVQLPAGYYSAFVELHIEQGPLLEREHIELGVVEGIAAPAALRVYLKGSGGHAGAVLMPQRRDAFLGAAELSLAVEAATLRSGSPDTVGTVGLCDIYPGAANSIPSAVKMEIDIRDVSLLHRDAVVESILRTARQICEKRKLEIETSILNADAPTKSGPAIVEALKQACQAENKTYKTMISRAYHDSLFMARIAPVAMLFIPCREGYSHRPDEFASKQDMANGVAVLARTLAALSGAALAS
jgi:N-carbamoyl-L-amino-acid hydrolase